jgi:hypothetical protein
MKRAARILMVLALWVTLGAAAQDVPPAPAATDGNPAFTQQELDQMLAPIALYPDALLSQVLMAATYPLEVVEAARWSRAHPDLSGDAAVQAVADQAWDPSVKSLLAFPQLLQTMDEKLDWTERLGDAFLSQQAQVMDTAQELRRRAEAAGNLQSSGRIEVQQEGGNIDIVPTDPLVVYVPYYDPSLVYGDWWWPEPPVFWAPWPGYAWYGDFAWGVGIGIGLDFFFGRCDWPYHRVFIDDRRHWFAHEPPERHEWEHNAAHRLGVPYRTPALNRQFGRAGASRRAFDAYRGWATPRPEPTPPVRAPQPQRGAVPTIRAPRPQRGAVPPIRAPQPPREGIPTLRTPQMAAPPRMAPQRGVEAQPQFAAPRGHAFEGIGRGPEVRDFSARGHQSFQNAPARSAPPPRR